MLKGEDCYTTVRHSWPTRARILLLALVVAAAPVANAVAPVLTQDDLISTWVDDNATGLTWSLPASTTVTKHEYRYKVWNRSEVPTSWTRDWTDLLLADTRCNVITNPGTPSQTASATQTGADCATKGSDATQSHRNWTTLGGLTNGARYTFELRAVNNDGNSDAITWNIALAADPDGVVTFSDPEFEGRVRTRAQAYFPSLGANDPITQLHMARLTWLHERGGARNVDNRIRRLDGIEYAVNLESLFIDFHQVLEIQRLQGLYEMEVFSFSGGLLSDVTPLQNLLKLERLLLNRGRSYPPPGVCTGTASSPEHGDTAVWPPAADCPADQLDDVVVRDLSSLRRLTKLRDLYVCDQRVDPRTLTALVNLEEMSYCRNDLRDISAMRGLTKMDKLYLFENRIEDVSPLAGMTELQFLQLHDNAIRDVSSLSGLTKLTSIYLSDNPLDAGACSTGGHATRTACTDASGTWTNNVVSTLTPLVTGSCSVAGQTTEADCTSNSGTWTAGTLKLIDLRGDTQLTDADVAALSGLTGVTVLHDSDIRPAVPTGMSATTSGRTVTLSWTDPSNAAIAAYQYRHRQGTGPWSDWKMTPEPGSSFHYWNRGDPALTSLALSDLPGGANTVQLRAVVASDYNNARNRNSDGTTFTAIKSHATAVTAAAVGAGRWDVGRVLTPGANTTVSVNAPVTASIASTAPTALAETNLDGATVVVELSGTTFGASLAASNFTLTTTPAIAGLSVASVSRSSDTRATLTLRFDDTNFDLQATLAVQVLAAALSSASNLDTQTVAVAPTLGLVFAGPTGIGMGMIGVDEDPGGVSANVAAYTIALAGQPTGAVTVTPTSSNSDVTITGITPPLSFDGTNWNTPQTVGVTAGQDGDALNDIAYIDHAVTGIPGLTAGGRLTLTVNDDETQGLTLAATTLTGSGVTEGGSAVTYTARLASAPTGPVRVQITGGAGAVSVDTAAAAGLQNTLLFNATNYSAPQTVTVTPLEDDDGESESVTPEPRHLRRRLPGPGRRRLGVHGDGQRHAGRDGVDRGWAAGRAGERNGDVHAGAGHRAGERQRERGGGELGHGRGHGGTSHADVHGAELERAADSDGGGRGRRRHEQLRGDRDPHADRRGLRQRDHRQLFGGRRRRRTGWLEGVADVADCGGGRDSDLHGAPEHRADRRGDGDGGRRHGEGDGGHGHRHDRRPDHALLRRDELEHGADGDRDGRRGRRRRGRDGDADQHVVGRRRLQQPHLDARRGRAGEATTRPPASWCPPRR